MLCVVSVVITMVIGVNISAQDTSIRGLKVNKIHLCKS
jgi:hypothetical protein